MKRRGDPASDVPRVHPEKRNKNNGADWTPVCQKKEELTVALLFLPAPHKLVGNLRWAKKGVVERSPQKNVEKGKKLNGGVKNLH